MVVRWPAFVEFFQTESKALSGDGLSVGWALDVETIVFAHEVPADPSGEEVSLADDGESGSRRETASRS
jgi:hypothetical protein